MEDMCFTDFKLGPTDTDDADGHITKFDRYIS